MNPRLLSQFQKQLEEATAACERAKHRQGGDEAETVRQKAILLSRTTVSRIAGKDSIYARQLEDMLNVSYAGPGFVFYLILGVLV